MSILDALIFFDNGATGKINDVLFEYGRLLDVLPLAVHPTSFGWTSRGDHSKMFLVFEFVVVVLVVHGLQHFSVKPQSLLILDLIGTWLGLGLGGFGTKGLGTGDRA